MGASAWSTVTLNKQYVGTRTEKAVLIKMPEWSIYQGYVTWISTKLVREKGSNQYTVAIRPGFDLILRMPVKNSDGNYTNADTKQITGYEFAKIFNEEHDNI